MRKFLVELQFSGKAYCGWQRQADRKTVQGEVEKALKSLFGTDTEAFGCSRTDSGVGAKRYYFHFSADTRLPEERIAYKLNRFLPKDIQAQNSREIPKDADARKDVRSKTYVYSFYDGEHLKPLINSCSYFVKGQLDLEKMNKACACLEGKHDFSAMRNVSAEKASPVKTVFRALVEKTADGYEFRVSGDGFLYNSVRIMAGTVIMAGAGKIAPGDVAKIILSKDRANAGPTLPPKGLRLDSVEYDKNL